MNTRFRMVWMLSLYCVISTGCGGSNAKYKCSGKITYNGTPLGAGMITFTSRDAGSISAPIKPDGTYEALDLTTSEYVVTIETESANPDKTATEYKGQTTQPSSGASGSSKYGKGQQSSAPKEKEHETAAAMSPKPKDATATKGTYVKIPERYADIGKSGLNVTLDKGRNTKDFDLKD